MKRLSFRLLATILTFILGVFVVFVWINYRQSPVQISQPDSSVGSNPEPEAETPKTNSSELASNRRLWEKNKNDNYNFVAEQFAGGMYPFVPFRIKVKNSKAISAKPVKKPLQLQRIDGYDKFDTVEKMFDEIQAAIVRGDNLTVTYNKELGFPEKISISSVNAGADGYWRIVITEFETIKAD
jgi:hypothetical protein